MLKWICIGILILLALCGVALIAALLYLLWKVIRTAGSMSDEITAAKNNRK